MPKGKKMNKTINDSTLAFNITDKTPLIRFLASLSDGRTVIQDDRFEGKPAWARLSAWLRENPSISITELRLQGPRGFEVKMPSNQRGYFFGNKFQAVWRGPQADCVGIGYYDGHRVNISWYRKPLFDHSSTEERTRTKAGFFLIENNNGNQKST